MPKIDIRKAIAARAPFLARIALIASRAHAGCFYDATVGVPRSPG